MKKIMKNLLLVFEFESVILAHFEDLSKYSKYNNFYGMEYVDFWPKILLVRNPQSRNSIIPPFAKLAPITDKDSHVISIEHV